MGSIGDFRLENQHIAVIVTDSKVALGFAESGGNLVDAAPHGGEDAMNQVFLYLDDTFPRQAIYEHVEATSTEGEEAAVTARGHDSVDPAIKIVTEYRLRSASSSILIRTTITAGDKPLSDFEVGDVIQWGHSEHFMPGQGFKFKGRHVAPWVAGVGPQVSYGYTTRDRELTGPSGSSWTDTILATLHLLPLQSASVERHLVVGNNGDVASLLPAIHELRSEPAAQLEGFVKGHAAYTRVVATDTGGRPLAEARTSDDGAYRLLLPPGDYLVHAEWAGQSVPPLPVSLGTAGTSLDLTLPKPADLDFVVMERNKDGTLVPSPAKITIRGQAPTKDPDLGPKHRNTAGNVVISPNGQGHALLPSGSYVISASRGVEFDLAQAQVVLAPGETERVELVLSRVVDTTGYLSADFHQHSLFSTDSGLAARDRVIANLAEGVEVAVATEHNQVVDLGPVVAELGVSSLIYPVVGVEATTETVGHFNAYPLSRLGGALHKPAPRVEGKRPDEILRVLRALESRLVIQVNHPRSGKNGYFDLVGWKPGSAPPAGTALDFDAIEVVNAKRWGDADSSLKDWYWLLSQGHKVTATGNSDSHAVFTEECGYPRNFLRMGFDEPERVTPEAILTAIKESRDVLVTNGPFVTLRVRGESAIGRTLAVRPGEVVPVEVIVQAAPWVDVDRIELLENGRPKGEPIAVTAGRDQVVRYRATWNLSTKRDSFFVVVVRGDDSLDPVVPTQDRPVMPLAITNPLWLKTR